MPQLQQLADWLLEQGVESVAKSTNVYWIPLYELLESCGIATAPRPGIAAACCGHRSVRTR